MGEYVITAGVSNNGILGKSDIEAKVFKSKTITVDMFGYAFYRSFNYKMVTHARVFSLTPKNKITENQGMFLESSLSYLKKLFGYENMCSFAKIKNLTTILPTKNGKIDFEFMETFVAELEAQRVAELEAQRVAELENYLEVSGLDDYELSNKELEVLESYNSVEWGEYRIGDLFDVQTYKKRFDANKVDLSSNGEYPYVVRKSSDNGIKGYIRESTDYLNDGNTISFGQDTATSFYQEKPYFTGDKIKILKPKFQGFRKENALLFVTAITRSFSKFSWGSSSYNVQIIQDQKICLPIKNGKMDINYIEIFLKAISKLIIKDVIKYADKRIAATKKIVNK